jgi:hypothetical protein
MINIITRTHNRPEYFKQCMASIIQQDYNDMNWIVGTDTECDYYPQAKKVYVNHQAPMVVPQGHYFAPWNKYLNELQTYVNEGWVMYLDDDDMFTSPKSLRRIANACTNENELVIWKVQILPNWIVPSHSFGHQVQAGDISGIGYAFHSKHLPVDWGHLSYGDYRVAVQLLNKGLKPRWIDMVLTRTQDKPNNGK